MPCPVTVGTELLGKSLLEGFRCLSAVAIAPVLSLSAALHVWHFKLESANRKIQNQNLKSKIYLWIHSRH